MDGKQKVEYSYVAFYAVVLALAIGLSWALTHVRSRSYRRLVPPLGLVTALLIFGGILVAQHAYPGG